jgi:MoxR-like ATPase
MSKTATTLKHSDQGLQNIKAIGDHLNHHMYERGEVIEAIKIALIGRYNVFLGGPPGTGKSKLARMSSTSIKDGRIWAKQIMKDTETSELFGPWDFEAIKKSRYLRPVHGNYVQNAHVVFADELDKGTSKIANAFLSAMNEHTYFTDGEEVPIPLRMFIGTVNTNLTSQDTLAFTDRFQFKFWVNYLRDEENVKKMILKSLSPDRSTQSPPQVSLPELEAMSAASSQVEFTQETLDILLALKLQFQQNERAYTDRRWEQVARVVQIRAFLDGKEQVDPIDLRTTQSMFVQKEKDLDLITIMDSVLPKPVVNVNLSSLRANFESVKGIRNPSQRIDQLRVLSSQVNTLIRSGNVPHFISELTVLKTQIIQELSV